MGILTEFSECSGELTPPLDARLAEYTFAGMGADHNGEVSKAEFFNVIKIGEFFPTDEELKNMDDSDADPSITMQELEDRMEESVESKTDARLLGDSTRPAFLGMHGDKNQNFRRGEFLLASQAFQQPGTGEQAQNAFAFPNAEKGETRSSIESLRDDTGEHFALSGAARPFATTREVKTGAGGQS